MEATFKTNKHVFCSQIYSKADKADYYEKQNKDLKSGFLLHLTNFRYALLHN